MSAHLPSASQQDPSHEDEHDEGSCGDDRRVQIYLSICDKKASHLDIGEIKKNSGADVHFSPQPSTVHGIKIAIICGTPSQIEAGVNIISQKIDPQVITSAKAQLHWLHWVEDAFPNLDSQSYFLPPVYFNRVPMTKEAAASQDVLVLQSPPGQAGQSNQPPMTASAASPQASPPGSVPCQSSEHNEPVKETGWRKGIEIISGIHTPVEIVTTADGRVLSVLPDVVHRRQIRHREAIKQVYSHMDKLYKKYGDHLDETPFIKMMHLVASAAGTQAPLPDSVLGQTPEQDDPVQKFGWIEAILIISALHRPAGEVTSVDNQTFLIHPDVIKRRSMKHNEAIKQVYSHMKKLYKKYGDHLDETPFIKMMHLVAAFYNFARRKWHLVEDLPSSVTQHWTRWHLNQQTDEKAILSTTSAEASSPSSTSTENSDDGDEAAQRKLEVRRRMTEAGWLFKQGNPQEILINLARNVRFSSVGETPFQQAIFQSRKEIEDAGLIFNVKNHFYIQQSHWDSIDQKLTFSIFQDTDEIASQTEFFWSAMEGAEEPLNDLELFGIKLREASDVPISVLLEPRISFHALPQTNSHTAQNSHLVKSSQTVGISPVAVKHFTPQTVLFQDSDVRDDSAMRRVLFCLQKMSEQNGEVLVGMTQLQFGQYLGEPCYYAAAAQLPQHASLPPALPRNWKQGDFDVLLIHRHYGFIVIEVKSFGDNVQNLNMSQQDIDKNIRKKIKQAISQLDKAEAMLSHLVSDISSGLRITKTIALPNLTAHQVQQAISCVSVLTQDLCRCLGTADPADITGLCLCSDQLSDPKAPWDVSSHVLGELGHWWQRRVAGAGPNSHMTCDIYRTLTARFCGPATTVTLPCTCPPRMSVKTLSEAVWCTGEWYTAQITLFPEQVHLLNTAPPRLFVAGPPGTGKTVVLQLMGTEWLLNGFEVFVLNTCPEGRAACMMLYHLLLQTVNTRQTAAATPGQLHLLQYDFRDGEEVEQAVMDLSQKANNGLLYVITDEAGRTIVSEYFRIFCEELLNRVPRLHLWASSYYNKSTPSGWQLESVTRPLRFPPAVAREVEKDVQIRSFIVSSYSERGVPDHTDGPPVTKLYHGGQGHSDDWPGDCVTCGRQVADVLHSLRIGVPATATPTPRTAVLTTTSTTPPSLMWRDVLVLSTDDLCEKAGMLQGLTEAGIPFQVMKDSDVEDVATARSDVVWVVCGDLVRGLERKVIVCLDPRGFQSTAQGVDMKFLRPDLNERTSIQFDFMSRCTSQLVIVSSDQSSDIDPSFQTCCLL